MKSYFAPRSQELSLQIHIRSRATEQGGATFTSSVCGAEPCFEPLDPLATPTINSVLPLVDDARSPYGNQGGSVLPRCSAFAPDGKLQ